MHWNSIALVRQPKIPLYWRCVQWVTKRSIQRLSSAEIRSKFVTYFKELDHVHVDSSSLIPQNDRSLLFTNAGMVQFKDYFINPQIAPYKSAVSVQKCMRAGGKHNDLDNVGYTPRHHTFFEMLGNFSFGKYSKSDAIQYAWGFLVDELKLPVDKLRVTVLDQDAETYDIWRNQVGLPSGKVIRSNERDNFWAMGDEGPCGPCTEIFFDTGLTSEADRWLEIWNLVFMQYIRHPTGKLENLDTLCVDTGMGLERLAAVLQRKHDNFEIDTFETIINSTKDLLRSRHCSPNDPLDHSLKIIADHLRAASFLISDGVIPSNVGRGYVLRRIIRRAVRAGLELGIQDPFLANLYPSLLATLPQADPTFSTLFTRRSAVESILSTEESLFASTITRGMSILNASFQDPDFDRTKTVPGNLVFELYDTYGFPFDLTELVAKEKGFNADLRTAECLLEKHKEMSRLNDTTTLIIDPCPFYGLGGGQVPDKGFLVTSTGEKLNVIDAFQPYENCIALTVDTKANGSATPELQVGEVVEAVVDTQHRRSCAVHHTATHMLNAALKRVLQEDSIVQAGSLVSREKLRFDFTYPKPLNEDQIRKVEDMVNEVAKKDITLKTETMPLSTALSLNATATFTEKYSSDVRVITIPTFSVELCGGTHISSTSSVYPFKILSEGSVAAGTRRIEAVAGQKGVELLLQRERVLLDVANVVNAKGIGFRDVEVAEKVKKLKLETKEKGLQIENLLQVLAESDLSVVTSTSINGLL
ncbi:tRNA synthetases class II (A)-domain-containing protein [Paraphysoderma sedebokerense]|nr:tRNA synthetases class II (A)-domain-containing protein [Paraphysoderma sedebokerense]